MEPNKHKLADFKKIWEFEREQRLRLKKRLEEEAEKALISARNYYISIGKIDYTTNPYILPDIIPIPALDDDHIFSDNEIALNLINQAKKIIGEYKDKVLRPYPYSYRPTPQEYVSAHRIERDYLEARNRAVWLYNEFIKGIQSLIVKKRRVEVIVDPIIFRYWYERQYRKLPTLRNNEDIKHYLRNVFGYTVREDGTDYLDLRRVSRNIRIKLYNDIDAYETNLRILRNILSLDSLFLEGVKLEPRSLVTVSFDNGNIISKESVILGNEALDKLYKDKDELIEIGKERFKRRLENEHLRPLSEETRELYREILEQLESGNIPLDLNLGYLSNEEILKIMSDIYRQLIGADEVVLVLKDIRNESGERKDEIQEFRINRPNKYKILAKKVILYGFFPYELRDNEFNFNVSDDCYCAVTSLTQNSTFKECYGEIEDIEKFTASIYYRANIPLYDKGLINKVQDIHKTISEVLNKSFIVEYMRYMKNGLKKDGKQKYAWRGERIRYPEKVKVLDKDIGPEDKVFRVLIYENKGYNIRHIFNVDDERAEIYLKETLKQPLPLRDEYKDLGFRGKANIFWSDVIVRLMIKEIEKDPKNLYKQLKFEEDGKIRNNCTKEYYKQGNFVKIASLNKEEQQKIVLDKKYTIYACLDFEASYELLYSMSWCFFTEEGLFEKKALNKVRNITVTTDREQLTENDIERFLKDGVGYMNSTSATECVILVHNGGKYDWPLSEKLFMKCNNVKLISPKSTNGCLIDLVIEYNKHTFRLRDSFRITNTKLANLPRDLGLKTTNKQKFMYRFYNELYQLKPEERKMEWKMEEIIEAVKDKDEDYNKEVLEFIEEYGVKNTYNIKEIVKEYCNNDVEVLRACMIRFQELMQDISKEDSFANTFKSLNPLYVGKYIENEEGEEEDDKDEDEREKKVKVTYNHVINPLDQMTLPSLTKRIATMEKAYVGAVKLNGPLNMYIRPGITGGRVWIRCRKKFISSKIEKIVKNPYFYVTDDNMAEYLVKYGYDKNKEMKYFDTENIPKEVVELAEMMEEYGTCLIDLDAVSLYPSAFYLLKYLPTGYPEALTEEDVINTSRERRITEEDDIWYGYFDIERDPRDTKYSVMEDGKEIEFCPFTKKLDGKTVSIGLKEKNYPLNIIDYKEFKHFYPNARLELVNGIKFTERSSAFSEFVAKLYCKRAYYKKLKKEGDPRGNTEVVIKLMLNSLYGNMIRKKIETETVYASAHSYEMIRYIINRKISKIFKRKDENLNKYCDGEKIKDDEKRSEVVKAIVKCMNELTERRIYANKTFKRKKDYDKIGQIAKDVLNILPAEHKLNDVEMIQSQNVGVNTYGLEIESRNLTHRLTYRADTKHETLPHWGSLMLSYSKALMNQATEKINYKLYITDTDSIHTDGSFMMNEEVRGMLDPEDEENPEMSMGKFHSDFEAKMWETERYKYTTKPINKNIGLCSIMSWFVDKKFYSDMVIGKVIETDKETGRSRGYIGINLHRRAKGLNAEIIDAETWDGLVEGEKGLEMDLLLYRAFSIKKNSKTGKVEILSRDRGDKMIRSIKPYNDR